MPEAFLKSPPVFVGMGELLWDCFEDNRRPGGAPANTAFHAHQLGCQSFIYSRVGEDPWGDALIQYIDGKGLGSDYIQRDSKHPTGEVTVDTSQPASPEYVIHENAAWDFIEFGQTEKELMARANAVCFGTLAQRNAVSRNTIHTAIKSVAPTTLVVYDVNLRQSYYDKEWIEQSLVLSTLVKLNIEEIVVLEELLSLGSFGPVQFANMLRQKYAVEIVCITRAAEGCLLVFADQVVDVPGIPVQVADTVGAGDAFNAALSLAHLQGLDPHAMAHFSNAMGGLVASRFGAMPDLDAEVVELKTRFGME